MCIAIYKKEGTRLTDDTLHNCWYANSDGAGFMYAEHNKLHVHKGYFTLDEFKEAYEPHKDKQAVVHFRIRTHGDINYENCHPYSVDRNLAFIHNGTISKASSRYKDKSDTWHFNEDVLKPLRQRYTSFFKDPSITY
jgi:predicted glutamine amidotransferase